MNKSQSLSSSSFFLDHCYLLNSHLAEHKWSKQLNPHTSDRLIDNDEYLTTELFGYAKLLELASTQKVEMSLLYKKAA